MSAPKPSYERASFEHAHPLCRQIFDHLRQRRIRLFDISHEAGVHYDTIRKWRDRFTPRLGEFEAVANAAGFKIVLVPMDKEQS